MHHSLPIVLAAMLLSSGAAAAEAAAERAVPGASEDVPVVIELFTSQGCSSCPPADRLLSRMRREAPAGVEVIPLAFHVDYWDYIGWQDPFASPAWSQRQRDYAASFEASRIYTPQLVVNGSSECVGSQRQEVRRLIAAAARTPSPARVMVEVEQLPGEAVLRVEAGATVPEGFNAAGRLGLYVALYESGLTTPVGRGENAHQTLHNDFVVRRLEPVLDLDGASVKKGVLRLPLEEAWDVEQMGVVAFLQESGSRAIHGAHAVRLAASN